MAERAAAPPVPRAGVAAQVDRALVVAAALIGTLPPSVLGAAALAAHLPVSRGVGLLVGIYLAIPLWIAAMCLGFLARRGWVAWLVCAALTIALTAVVPRAAFLPSMP